MDLFQLQTHTHIIKLLSKNLSEVGNIFTITPNRAVVPILPIETYADDSTTVVIASGAHANPIPQQPTIVNPTTVPPKTYIMYLNIFKLDLDVDFT